MTEVINTYMMFQSFFRKIYCAIFRVTYSPHKDSDTIKLIAHNILIEINYVCT